MLVRGLPWFEAAPRLPITTLPHLLVGRLENTLTKETRDDVQVKASKFEEMGLHSVDKKMMPISSYARCTRCYRCVFKGP